MNSSSVTVRQRGVGLRCRPIGQQRSCLRRSFESAQYTSLAFGAAGKPACAHPWDPSVTPTTTPCARASSPHWNASCWPAAASHRRPRPGWRSSATSKGGTIPLVAIPAPAIYPNRLRDADAQGNPNDLSDKPSTEPGQLQIGVDRLQPFSTWLNQHHHRGWLGEYGVPDNDLRWLTVLDKLLATMQQQGIWGTYRAGGPWWGDSRLSCEPQINGNDAVQMTILQKYPST